MIDFSRPYCLTIGGSDCSGGAGIQADLRTLARLDVWGLSVLTAITAQNSREIRAIFDLPVALIRTQLEAILDEFKVAAVKIGMLHLPETVHLVADILKKYQVNNIVVDPLMIAKTGDRLLQRAAQDVLKNELFPLAVLISPNIPEAGILTGRQMKSREEMESAAIELLKIFPDSQSHYILLKGGHLPGNQCPDVLVGQGGLQSSQWFESPRIVSQNTHGTGCIYSSAIAAFLGRGEAMIPAVRKAKKFLMTALYELS